jgi:hypothetical protein
MKSIGLDGYLSCAWDGETTPGNAARDNAKENSNGLHDRMMSS